MAASIKMAFIAIVSVLFQFGLAILGGVDFPSSSRIRLLLPWRLLRLR